MSANWKELGESVERLRGSKNKGLPINIRGLQMIELWDAVSDIPKHETVEQWESRTGEQYRGDAPVYIKAQVGEGLKNYEYQLCDYRCSCINGCFPIYVATHHGKPPIEKDGK